MLGWKQKCSGLIFALCWLKSFNDMCDLKGKVLWRGGGAEKMEAFLRFGGYALALLFLVW